MPFKRRLTLSLGLLKRPMLAFSILVVFQCFLHTTFTLLLGFDLEDIMARVLTVSNRNDSLHSLLYDLALKNRRSSQDQEDLSAQETLKKLQTVIDQNRDYDDLKSLVVRLQATPVNIEHIIRDFLEDGNTKHREVLADLTKEIKLNYTLSTLNLVGLLLILILFSILTKAVHYLLVKREDSGKHLLGLASKVFDTLKNPVLIVDDTGKVLIVTTAYERSTGFSRMDAVGNPLKEALQISKTDNFDSVWSDYLKNRSWIGTVLAYSKTGDVYVQTLKLSPVDVQDSSCHLVEFVNPRSDTNKAMGNNPYDSLTHLPNRNLLTRVVNSLILDDSENNDSTFVLLSVELLRFKAIVANYGHSVGDEVIKHTAGLLERLCRNTDFVSMYSVDIFMVVLKQVTRVQAKAIADKLLHKLDKVQFESSTGNYIPISVVIGVSVYPDDGKTADILISKADLAATYAASSIGSSLLFYGHGSDSILDTGNYQLESDLARSVDRLLRGKQDHDFRLVYQPQVRISDLEIIGYEVLLRWRDIPPSKFVPLLEASNLIIPVGEWILRQALGDFHRVPSNSVVGVNISVKQMSHPLFCDTMSRVLKDTRFDPERVEVEVTETLFIDDPAKASQVLLYLRGLGIKVSIDDFGSGYSSLARLTHLPITRVKIDGVFTSEFDINQQSRQLITSIVHIGKNLHIEVLAECVENLKQFLFLRSIGCDTVQGYLFSKPIPITDIYSFVVDKAMINESE